MVAWLFPGQGSQRRGMGGELFERYPQHLARADEQLGYSVRDLCLEDPDGRLKDTRYVQPALFVVSALAGLARAETEAAPSHLAGHSLGEYAALFAAGCFDFDTGVKLVERRGALMAQAQDGGMLAVLRLPLATVAGVIDEGGHTAIDVANINAPDQVVLSGPTQALAAFADDLKDRRVGRSVALPVSAAFHSRYLLEAQRGFADFVAGFDLQAPSLPVLSNVSAQPHRPEDIAGALVAQISRPVQWSASVQYLLAHGVEDAVELGPGTVLTELWNAARRNHRAPGPPTPAAVPAIPARSPVITPESLGDAEFRRDYGIRYAYLAGSMYHGIASTDLVLRMGRAGMMGFFGTGGLPIEQIEAAIVLLQQEFCTDHRFGMNLLCTLDNPDLERAIVELYLRHGVRHVEAAAFPQVTAQLVRWRFTGAGRDPDGHPLAPHRIVAKVSRPEVARAFMSPPPARMVAQLLACGELTPDEAAAAALLPVSADICVESDSGGHTDGGVALALLPSMMRLRDDLMSEHSYRQRIRIGAAGGLGSPEALAAVFVLGADFVLTGSINQCSPEAGTSPAVKDLLATLDVQDTTYAPAGDLFELGTQVQVVRRGTLFAVRAGRLYDLYRRHAGLDDIDPQVRRSIEDDYFGRSFEDVWAETRDYLAVRHPEELARAQTDPRRRMVLVFRWYFRHSTQIALDGDAGDRVDFQIHCGPAMGSFNRWVAGTDLQDWRARHVDVIGERLVVATADLLSRRFAALSNAMPSPAQL